MKNKASSSGYTIVELLIVITVMGVVAVSAITSIRGQQGKTEFTQGVREFENRLNDVADDISRGYFPDTGSGQVCAASVSGISFSSGSSTQGGSSECVLAGKALAFEPDDIEGGVDLLTVASRRTTRDDRPVTSLDDLSSGDIRVAPQLSDSFSLSNGIRVSSIRIGTEEFGAIAFVTGFSNSEQRSGGVRFSGVPQTDLYAVSGTIVGQLRGATDGALSQPSNYREVIGTDTLEICLEHGTGGRTALVEFGKDGRQLTTTTEFDAPC